MAFCMKAMEYDLILVLSDSLACPDTSALAYCIDTYGRRSSARSPCSKSSPTRCTAQNTGPQATNTRESCHGIHRRR